MQMHGGFWFIIGCNHNSRTTTENKILNEKIFTDSGVDSKLLVNTRETELMVNVNVNVRHTY